MTEQPIRITAAARMRHGNTRALAIALDKLGARYLENTGKLNGSTVIITMKVEKPREDHDQRPTHPA